MSESGAWMQTMSAASASSSETARPPSWLASWPARARSPLAQRTSAGWNQTRCAASESAAAAESADEADAPRRADGEEARGDYTGCGGRD